MVEFFQANQTPLIIVYCCVLLYINTSYLREYRQVNDSLQDMSSEDVLIKTESFIVILFTLGFAFFRSWLIYLIAYNLTDYMIIVLILALFIIIDAYHAIFNHTVEKLRKTKIVFLRSIADTFFIIAFVVSYYIV